MSVETVEETIMEKEVSNLGYILSEDVSEFIKKGAKVIFLFMPNSSSSRFQEERIQQAFEVYGDKFSVGMIDILHSQEYAISMNVRSFPTTLYFKDGELMSSETGVQRDVDMSVMQIM